MTIEAISNILKKSRDFEFDAHRILAIQENSISRIIIADNSRRRLKVLSLPQEEMFTQAITCTEHSLFKAAHVMAWAGFMDYVEQIIVNEYFSTLTIKRPTWVKYNTVEEIRENIPEFQIIDAARDVGMVTKSETKTIHGLLSKRNECAHPSGYSPDLNECLGYLAEILNRIENINNKL